MLARLTCDGGVCGRCAVIHVPFYSPLVLALIAVPCPLGLYEQAAGPYGTTDCFE